MKKLLALLALSVFLAGCGEQPSTPLAHALAAYRTADHEAFLAAKTEARDALKTAIKMGDDLCFVTVLDVVKYGAVRIIDKLDRPELFKANEEVRFVYALNLVGKSPDVEPDGFLAQSPMARNQYMESCADKDSKATAARVAVAPAVEVEEEGRAIYMRDWRRDMKSQYGGAYDEKMRSALSSLQNMGYSAVWPPETDLVE